MVKNRKKLTAIFTLMVFLSNILGSFLIPPSPVEAYQAGQWIETGAWGGGQNGFGTDGVDIHAGKFKLNKTTDIWEEDTNLTAHDSNPRIIEVNSNFILAKTTDGRILRKDQGTSNWYVVCDNYTFPSLKFMANSNGDVFVLESAGLYKLNTSTRVFDLIIAKPAEITASNNIAHIKNDFIYAFGDSKAFRINSINPIAWEEIIHTKPVANTTTPKSYLALDGTFFIELNQNTFGNSPKDVYKSIDEGLNWQYVTTLDNEWSLQLGSNQNIMVKFKSGYSIHYSYSSDGGTNWGESPIFNGINDLVKTSDNTIYISNSMGIWKTTDWVNYSFISEGLNTLPVSKLFYSSDNTKYYAVAENVGIYESTDEGLNWNPIIGSTKTATSINADTIITIDNGVAKLHRRNTTTQKFELLNETTGAWSSINNRLDVAVDKLNTNRILVISDSSDTLSGGVFESLDGGYNWSQVLPMPTGTKAMSLHQRNDGVFFVGTSKGDIYTDEGGTWTTKATNIPSNTILWDFSESVNGTMWTVGSFGSYGIYKSTDGGSNWTNMGYAGGNSGRIIKAIEVVNEYTILIGASDGTIYRTVDTGTNWTLDFTIPNGHEINDLTIYPNAYVYAGTDRGVWDPPELFDNDAPILSVSHASGTYDGAIYITMSINENGKIYFTTDGTDPTTSSTEYTAPIKLIDGVTEIKVIAEDSAYNLTGIQSFTYTVNKDTTMPVITASVPSGDFSSNFDVALSSDKPYTQIYYTLDGAEPTISSNLYSTPITIDSSGGNVITLKFMGIDDSNNQSATVTRTYTYVFDETPSLQYAMFDWDTHYPWIDGLSLSYEPTIRVLGQADREYFVNIGEGNIADPTPTTHDYTWSNTQYNIPHYYGAGNIYDVNVKILIRKTSTGELSTVKTFTYNVDKSMPVISSNYTKKFINQPFGLELNATKSANIYYTTDGNFPDNTSTPYTGTIMIDSNNTPIVINAIAYDSGGMTSNLRTYNFEWGVLPYQHKVYDSPNYINTPYPVDNDTVLFMLEDSNFVYHIYKYNFSTATTQRLTNNTASLNSSHFHAKNGYAVWQDENGDIVLMNMTTETTVNVTNNADGVVTNIKPYTDGKKVVWVEEDNSIWKYKLKIYDIITQQTTDILTNQDSINRPVVNDHVVAWRDSNNSRILNGYNLSTQAIEQLWDNPNAEWISSTIDADNNFIYIRNDNTVGSGYTEIGKVDPISKTHEFLTDGTVDMSGAGSLGAFNERVVFERGSHIYLIDGGTETRLWDNMSSNPKIHEDLVAFVDNGNLVVMKLIAPDTTPPVVTASNSGGIFTSPVTLSLTIDESGDIFYRLNSGTWTQYVSPIEITDTTTMEFYGQDIEGNTSSTNTINFIKDTTPPVVTPSVTTSTFTESLDLELTINKAGTITYALNGGLPVTYTVPIQISETTIVEFWGTDLLGNVSIPVTETYTKEVSIVTPPSGGDGGGSNYSPSEPPSAKKPEIDTGSIIDLTEIDLSTPISLDDSFDDTKEHWANEAITRLKQAGIITGYEGNKFKPNDKITRGEFIVMMVRAIERMPEVLNEPSFIDEIPYWARESVIKSFNLKVINGYPDNTFKAGNQITRAEMATIFSRIAEISNLQKEVSHTVILKDDIPKWAIKDVNKVISLGLVEGYGNGTFKPHLETTRAEMAVVLYRLLTNK